MYPYQRTPIKKSLYKPYIVGIYGYNPPQIPREHNKYRGYTSRGPW